MTDMHIVSARPTNANLNTGPGNAALSGLCRERASNCFGKWRASRDHRAVHKLVDLLDMFAPDLLTEELAHIAVFARIRTNIPADSRSFWLLSPSEK
jgi:hypothetical protein